MKIIYHLFFLLLSLGVTAQNQLWKDYYSYNDVRSLTSTSSMTYFVTENSAIVFNDTTGDKKIYNTINGLKLDDITTIAYSGGHNKLIIGNKKGNIAIINLNNDNILYLNDIAQKTSLSETEKKINKIAINGGFAYVATGYGISQIRIEDNHFGDSYYLGSNGSNKNVIDVTIDNNDIYAIVEGEGIKKGNLQQNLIHYSQWQLLNDENWNNIEFINNVLTAYNNEALYEIVGSTKNHIISLGNNIREIIQQNNYLTFTFTDRIHVSDLSYNIFYSLDSTDELKNFSTAVHKDNKLYVASREHGLIEVYNNTMISPNGPYSNNSFRVRNSFDNELWVIFGGHDISFNPYTGGIKKVPFSVLKNNKWFTVPYSTHKTDASSDISFDPRNKSRAYLSSYYNGITKIENINKSIEQFGYTIYNASNSNISLVGADQSVRVLGLGFDKNGIGWATSSLSPLPLTKIDQYSNITSYNIDNSSTVFLKPEIDVNETKWIPTFNKGIFAINEKTTKTINFLIDNSSMPHNRVNIVKLDKNNQLWIGTVNGLRVIPNVNQFMTSNNVTLTNIVIDDNGTAEELFYQQNILDIFVDGSNNKWISIADAGVFYISPNGQEEILHFSTDNSPLPSNNIHTISMNEATGEVFFATNKGIVSYTSATSAVGKKDLEEVFVYPNPVRPDFNGEIKIAGLMEQAIVKITDTSGYLVYETTSTSGTVTWNTTNFSGNKVPSGVYIIFISSADGLETTSRKLTIIR